MILAIGCRFSDIHCSSWVPGYTYNIPPTRLIHVDLDPQEIGRNYPTELGIIGDAREVLKQLLEMAGREPKRERSPWIDQVEAWKEEWSNFIEPEKASNEVPIDPRRVIAELRKAAPDDTLMITDTGNHQTWVEQYWEAYEPRSVFTPGGFAGMGFGTCGVLGVKLARPDRPAVCVTSDGSFMMFPGSVATAVEHDIPAVWVIMNNYTIGVIRDLQRFYMDGREIGTSFVKQSTGEFWNPDFAAMAQAMGAGGISVDQPGDLADAFDTAMKAGTPYVIDVKVNRDTAVPLIGTWQFPPITQAEPTFGSQDAGHITELHYFPFSAIVGQERLKQALLLNAVNPAVGGVLIKGPSGTGKSTAVRGLAELLPEIAVVADCPFSCDPDRPMCSACRERERDALPVIHRRRRIVDLPLNATEDRVSGSVDVARALKDGERALEPGLLAEANRGILYVDEINLLDDHLTDVLLDAAALGVNVVEREGVSVSHPARFLLVGTMNEEEGELRPQIADRIGLEVEVEALADPGLRGEIVRRRESFAADPEAFRETWASAQAELAGAIASGEALLASVRVPDPLYAAVGRLVVGSGVNSHRADISIIECAKALAALDGRGEVDPDDILRAAELALGHRLETDPFGPSARVEPQQLRRLLDDALEIEVSRKKVEQRAS